MSDTDWSSSEGEEEGQSLVPQPVESVEEQQPVREEEKKKEDKIVLLAQPILLQLLPEKVSKRKQEASVAQGAGLVVLFEHSINEFSLYSYDASNPARGFILQPYKPTDNKWADFRLISGKEAKIKALNPAAGSILNWKITFKSREDAFQLQCFILLGMYCTAVSIKNTSIPYAQCTIKKAKESKKKLRSCKKGYIASVFIQSWLLPICDKGNMSVPNRDDVKSFKPHFNDSDNTIDLTQDNTDECNVVDILVEGAIDDDAPPTIGHFINGMKIGSSKLLLLPCISPLVQSSPLLMDKLRDAEYPHMDSVLYLLVQIKNVKKSDEKKQQQEEQPEKEIEKEMEEKEQEQNVDDVNEDGQEEDVVVEEEPKQSQQQPQPQQITKAETPKEQEEQEEDILEALKSEISHIGKLQLRFLSLKSKQIFSNTSKYANENEIKILGKSLKNMLSSYKTRNSDTDTIGSLAHAMEQVITLQKENNNNNNNNNNNENENIDSRTVMQYKQLEQEYNEIEGKVQHSIEEQSKIDTELVTLREKQMQLMNDNADMEKKISDMDKSKTMTQVFAKGMEDMRELLGREMIAHREAKEAVNDLQIFQVKTKKTWVPRNHSDRCLMCTLEFDENERRQTWCRYCGRLFCSSCCQSEIRIPKIYNDELVVVCDGCKRVNI